MSSSQDTVVSVRGLSKCYRITSGANRATTVAEALIARLRNPIAREKKQEFWALRDVSFEITRGEVVGIIGRNGAGKSTLLKILSQITEPTRGEIDLYGRVGSLLEVGTGFHPELTGRENIYLNGAILGMKRRDIERQFDSIVEFAGTEAFLDTPVKRYSSGMYVRLAFAVAAHLSPDVLVVDEVLAVGDLAFQKKCLGKMQEVAESEGRTVLFVSHNMAAVRRLCTRAIFLDGGQLRGDGPVEKVIDQYMEANGGAEAANTEFAKGDGPAWATSLNIRALGGDERAQFRLGEPWRAQIVVELADALPHVIVGFGIQAAGAVPVVTWWSRPEDLQAGRYMVEFECKLPIAAGEYRFAVGISSNERSVWFRENTGQLEISEIAEGEQPVRSRGTGMLVGLERPPIQPYPSSQPVVSV